MGRLNLDEIQAGMQLAADVTDLNGRILLKAGSEISDRHLKLFKMWGVTDADVTGVQREDIAQVAIDSFNPALLAEAERTVAELFQHTDRTHPAVAELSRLATFRMVRRSMKESTHDS